MNIGVTGLFLSGKSTISALIAENLGAFYFNADDYVHHLYEKENFQKKIVDKLGKEFYKDNKIDKRLLSKLVFNSESALNTLESIIHPLVQSKVKDLIFERTGKMTVFEIPLLFEKRWDKWMDVSILVMTSYSKRLERAKLRGYSKVEAEKRWSFQWDDSEKFKFNPWIIKNNGKIDDLKGQVTIFLKSL